MIIKIKNQYVKKGVTFTLRMLGICITFAIIGWGLGLILLNCGLMFRSWVVVLFNIILSLFVIAFIGGLLYTLRKVFSVPQEKKKIRITQKILAASGITIVLFGAGVLGFTSLFIAVFRYDPEHVVEKYGQKMVAYVDSYMDVYVYYFEYKNFLVCGYPAIGEEWYGNGGYDPFERDPAPKPKTYTFYDLQGNVVARSEEQPDINQDKSEISDADNTTDIRPFPPKKMRCTFSESDEKAFSEMSYSADGENWEIANTGYHYQFSFKNTGYLIFSYDWAMQYEAAAIYTSNDNGDYWTYLSDTPSDELLQNAAFFNESTGVLEYGIAGTDSYVLYVTTDGANSFNKVELPAEIQGQLDQIKKYIEETN